MKCFVVAFVTFAVISLAIAEPAIGDGKILLGNELKAPVANLVQEVVQFLAVQILQLIPPTAPVPLATLLAALTALGAKGSISAILTGVLALYKKDGSKLIAILPKIVANYLVVIADLAKFLTSQLPAGAKTAPFGAVLSILGLYLLNLLINYFVTFLNSLS